MAKKYIDAEQLEKEGYELIHIVAHHNDGEELCWTEVEYIKPTEYQHAADVVEVRHGRWEWNNEEELFYSCSNCGYKAYGNTLEIVSGVYNYCPNCGASMEDEE